MTEMKLSAPEVTVEQYHKLAEIYNSWMDGCMKNSQFEKAKAEVYSR